MCNLAKLIANSEINSLNFVSLIEAAIFLTLSGSLLSGFSTKTSMIGVAISFLASKISIILGLPKISWIL